MLTQAENKSGFMNKSQAPINHLKAEMISMSSYCLSDRNWSLAMTVFKYIVAENRPKNLVNITVQ